MRQGNFIKLLLILAALIAVSGCGSAAIPAADSAPAAAAAPTDTPTLAPTVSLPTAAPTSTPAPPTPTATLTIKPTRRATSTPAPSATPTPAEQVYEVQPGDTLLAIAIALDVPLEALAEANNLTPDDFLQIGQELSVPVSTDTPASADAGEDATEPGADPAAGAAESVTASNAPSSAPAETTDEAGSAPVVEESANAPAAVAPPAPVSAGPPAPTFSHAANINPLTGLPVDDPAKLQRRPILVRIGNDVGARASQVGLNSADMVYEEITEWWVTRYTAVFLSNMPTMVAPIRSARLINVQLVPQYQGALAHSGGSDPVRWEISQAPIANLDEFYTPAPYFYREGQGWQTRLALDVQAARNFMAKNGLDASVSQIGFPFSETIERGEAAPNIYIPYPRATSFTHWQYDAGRGKYVRWINGSPLIDAGDGSQVAAANVVIYFAQHQETDIVEDSNGATAIRIIMNGSGPAWFFRDGKLNRGTWQSNGSRTPYFADEDGTPYPLKPGNTWVEVVPTYFTIGLNSADEASSRP